MALPIPTHKPLANAVANTAASYAQQADAQRAAIQKALGAQPQGTSPTQGVNADAPNAILKQGQQPPNANGPWNATGTNVFRSAIFDRMKELSGPITANSDTIRAQTEGYDIKSQRGLEDTRRALAEAAYAGGNMGTGGYAEQQQRAIERAAADRAGFVGNAVKDAEAQRMAELGKTLGLGQQYELQDSELAAKESQFGRQLAQANSHFTLEQAQSNSHFQATLANNKDQFAQQMGFNYKELDQNQKQFVDKLAQDKALAEMNDATQRAGIGASSGAAAANLAYQRERALEDDRRWSAYNTADVINAANQAAIRKALLGE